MKLAGNNIYVRFLEPTDAEALLNLRVRNKDFFTPFIFTQDDEFYTFDQQLKLIERGLEKKELDQQYSFGIYLKESNELIGNVTLMEVLRSSLQSCYIGYTLDKNYNGKGYMTEAVQLVTEYGFNVLQLHRIEAGVMPHNLGSIKVLEKVGYVKEGIARKNVKINGKWEDHQVLAILNPND